MGHKLYEEKKRLYNSIGFKKTSVRDLPKKKKEGHDRRMVASDFRISVFVGKEKFSRPAGQKK